MSDETPVPDEAVERFLAEVPIETMSAGAGLLAGLKRGIEAAAPLIVAAELDRLTEALRSVKDSFEAQDRNGYVAGGVQTAINHLAARASVLRGEGQTHD